MIAITDCTRNISQGIIEALLLKGNQLKVLIDSEAIASPALANWSDNPNVTLVPGDILDVTALNQLCEGAEKVYHFAEKMLFDKKLKKQMYQYNIEGTANVVNCALAHQAKKLIFSSHYAALGNKIEGQVYDETAKWEDFKTAQGYGWSKHLAEREVWRGINEGLDAIIFNFGQIFGNEPFESPFQELCAWMLEEKKYVTGNFPWIDENDLVDLMLEIEEGRDINEQVLLFNQVMDYHELLKYIVDFQDQTMDDFEEVTQQQLKTKGRFLKWLPWKKSTDWMLNQTFLSLVSEKRNYSNAKMIEWFDFEFSDKETTLSKVAQQF
jgi:nucleoside-diphosphate-sugar epimerase